ncbi:hypothetical protein BF93_16285 [Brachybacterium phenoliresistens]|uniref:Uncharacterized protein n=1 Tax=Brachybacterium phenoliresistens TaxID=396014 RepID=Z9JVF3_9MICO|nr:hypothetical protein [Brachybacterium phenoliresistens]EWS81757.1 hypothetical protein BF93_16285 [Brachybacterium phenoliresistens]
MSHEPSRPADLELDDLVDAMDELLGIWERWVAIGSIRLNPRREFSKTQRQAAVIVTLTQHLFQLVKTVRPYLPESLPITLVPVAREALETGIWVVWMDRFEDAAEAAINEADRNRKNLREAMVKSALIPEGMSTAIPDWSKLDVAESQHLRSFEKMTDALGLPEMYAYYRMLSELSHPGIHVADEYILEKPDGSPAFRDSASPGIESILATRLLPFFLLKAARIVSYMTRDVEQRREVRAVARKLRVDSERLFGPTW